MAKTDFKSVDDYIKTHPEEVQAILQRVRKAIRKALPGAQEVISYQIPAYKLHGSRVVYFAGWKQHYSLYPANDHLVRAFKNDLVSYEVSKGTIRFPLSDAVPDKLIGRIAKFRAKQAAERAPSKPPVKKKR